MVSIVDSGIRCSETHFCCNRLNETQSVFVFTCSIALCDDLPSDDSNYRNDMSCSVESRVWANMSD